MLRKRGRGDGSDSSGSDMRTPHTEGSAWRGAEVANGGSYDNYGDDDSDRKRQLGRDGDYLAVVGVCNCCLSFDSFTNMDTPII